MNDQDVEWRVIPSLPTYEASSLGQIRKKWVRTYGRPGVILSQVDTKGYLSTSLTENSRSRLRLVNRLICEAFYGPPPSPFHQAAHGDGDPKNNAASNLRWATPSQNAKDKDLHGTSQRGERHVKSKLSDEAVAQMRRIYRDRERTIQEIAWMFNVSRIACQMAIVGRTWKHVTIVPPVPLEPRG